MVQARLGRRILAHGLGAGRDLVESAEQDLAEALSRARRAPRVETFYRCLLSLPTAREAFDTKPIGIGQGRPFSMPRRPSAAARHSEACTASTGPGCRRPHGRLVDAGSLDDAMGADCTLLRCHSAIDVVALEAAASTSGLPLKTLDIDGPDTAGFCGGRRISSAPHQHMVWLGDNVPTIPWTWSIVFAALPEPGRATAATV